MDHLDAHDKEAAEYDRLVREYNAYSHDVLFGMTYEYVKPRETLLDIGIGTGLASQPFAKAGLEVHGLDGSTEMLKVCESKAFAKDLKQFDLRTGPLPYPDHSFDHVICCGVLHFFGELKSIVKEVSRVIKPGGVFAVTIAAQTPEEEAAAGDGGREIIERPTPWDVYINAHGDRYMDRLLNDHGFKTLKVQKLLMWSGSEDAGDLLFKVLVARAG
jgi:ubiquinone/menaquinone biosynthesis C-methylase UbiE